CRSDPAHSRVRSALATVGRVRLHHFRPDELNTEQRELYDVLTKGSRAQVSFPRTDIGMTDAEGRLQGPFNAMLHHPRLGFAVQEVSRRLRFEGVLTHRTREIVILIVAASQRSEFEWAAHASIAGMVGIADDEINALAAGDDIAWDDPA